MINLTIEDGDNVKPCPFCGEKCIDMWNTHRACYTVQCLECGAEITGKAYGSNVESSKLTRRHHSNAKLSALVAWNRRSP